MKKTRIFASATVVVAAALLLTGCWGSSSKPTIHPTSTASSSDTGSVTIGSSPSASATPSPTATYTSKADPGTPSGSLAFAETLFPNAAATKSYTKDQVLLALYSAYTYAQHAENASYFISGQWAKDGYTENAVETQFANVYTDSAMNQLLSYVASIKSDKTSGQQVFSALSFLPVGGSNYTVCANKAQSCQEQGYPKFTTGMTWQETSDGRLSVSFTIESRITMTVNGESGYLPLQNSMTLFLKKNDSYKSQVGTYPFLIDGWSNNVTRSSFTR